MTTATILDLLVSKLIYTCVIRAQSGKKEVPVCLPHGERGSASLYRGSGGIAPSGVTGLCLWSGGQGAKLPVSTM